MKIKEIRMTVKRVQFQEVVVSLAHGFEMPTTGNALVELSQSMKNETDQYCHADEWKEGDEEVVSFFIEEDDSK